MHEVLTLSLPKAQTRNSLEEKPPFEEHFQTIEDEEKGDCAFIAIVQAMSINSGGFAKASKDDFSRKGRLKPQLRLLCSKELAKAPEGTYTVIAAESTSLSNQVLQAGFSACGVSLASLAEATHHEFRVWAWCSEKKRWKFYLVSPKANKKQSPGLVWLKLHKEPYECLVPKELPKGTSPNFTSKPKCQHSAMSILGLTPASSSRVASPSGAAVLQTRLPLKVLKLVRVLGILVPACSLVEENPLVPRVGLFPQRVLRAALPASLLL